MPREEQIKPQERDEPTVVQKGVMTEKQRRHSKEFENREIPSIDADKDRDAGVYIEMEPEQLPDKSIVRNADDYLRALTCANITDLVVVGKIGKKSSQLTENARFVFTDYDLGVLEVLKSPIDFDMPVDKQITITDPGGAVKVDGRVISVIINREQPLLASGRYLLFLHRLKGSDSYRLIGERGIFGIYDNQVKPSYYNFREKSGYGEVLQKIRSTTLTCQATKKKK
jgi:hypothetical protein